jgi:glycosyltransferase involved in cell wall biosynthesis
MTSTGANQDRPGRWAGRTGGGAQRILVVLHDLPLGGSERIAIRLANQWAALGRDVTLLCGEVRGPLTALVSPAVAVVECDPPIPRGRGSRKRLGAATAAHIAAHRPDLLFVPGNYHWPILPVIARLPRAERPIVIAQISTPLYRPGRGPIRQVEYNFRTRRNLACADVAISLSDPMTDDADRVLRRPITQRLNLPALGDLDPAPLAPPQAELLILCAGRLSAVKGFDVAVRAFAALGHPTAKLVIVGEGPMRKRLVGLARELGVADRVGFPGYVPDIRPWLDCSRLLLLTSVYEGYAAVVVEALAAGRPVVATDCTPAACDLLDRPERGVVAPIGDVEALSDGLRQVLSRPAPDPARLAEAVSGYRMGPIAEGYLDIFDAAVVERAQRPAPVDQVRRRRLRVSALRPSSARLSGETS